MGALPDDTVSAWRGAVASGATRNPHHDPRSLPGCLSPLAILTFVVFLSSQAALCRIEWLNAAVVERLARLDVIYGVAGAVMIGSGVARLIWGVKGASWYLSQPLFHIKITLVLAMVLLSFVPSAAFRRWRQNLRSTGALPPAAEIARVRRLVMIQSHVLPVVAVIAVFWARGW